MQSLLEEGMGSAQGAHLYSWTRSGALPSDSPGARCSDPVRPCAGPQHKSRPLCTQASEWPHRPGARLLHVAPLQLSPQA